MRKSGFGPLLRRVMAVAAVAVTMAALMRPALTLEADTLCGMEEHQHGDVCFSVREILRCSAVAHAHTDACRNGEGELCCGYTEHLMHIHDRQCYDRENQLRCPLTEKRLHTHEPGCFLPDSAGTPVLVCEKPEIQLHIHIPVCRDEDGFLCGQLQTDLHSHDDSCFGIESILTCQLPEHVHTADCIPEEVQEELQLPEERLDAAAAQPKAYTPQASETDLPAVSGNGISFRLFNYSLDINKDASGTGWRTISDYFTFRNSKLSTGETPSDTVHIPAHNLNASHDADGFPAAHATVERTLQQGMPVLDLSRNADGTARSDPGIGADVRSLSYLFGGSSDPAVTAYAPGNTILQKDGSRYWYDSRLNAVDYDPDANLFRLRSYAERNSTTAGYGTAYGDFLPFNYTGGVTIHDPATETAPYHILSADADYWFGMTMQVNFYQSRDGLLGGENMIFRFSGDDDVWVFVDDVLVLDLGGTHGTVDGSIDFATGQVLQYLSWGGANATDAERTNGSDTSFPTTLRACFDAAGRTPNGGWSEDGNTFADYTEHTLTFFYLERGAAVANCKLDFRLPTLPDKSLTVTKELTAEGEVGDFLRESLPYQFRVVKAQNPQELYLTPGMAYTLLKDGSAVGTGTVDPDGTFRLKAGESAQFTDMLVKGGGAKEYVVQEIMPDGLTGQYSGVEYTVSGAGGTTQTEEGPSQAFTAFVTAALSAEQTQVVTFRNQVDVSKLSRLAVTKLQAEGSVFAEDAQFPIQITLGGELLPVGSRYQVGDAIYTVTTEGILPLKIGQTAVLLQGILSGTAYEVTELDSENGSFRPSYSGTVTPEGSVTCTASGASGEFPLNSAVHITVTNASFDYALPIPVRKQALHNQADASFLFRIQRVMPLASGGWENGEELHGTTITVTGDSVTEGTIHLGFRSSEAGTHYFRVWEQPGQGNFLYDETFYILEITAQAQSAQITAVWKNGTQLLPPDTVPSFENRRTAQVQITKTILGGNPAEEFVFTASVTLDGTPVLLPGMEEETIRFTLSHHQTMTLTGIPWGALVEIREESYDHYIPSFRVGEGDPLPGSTAQITVGQDVTAVHFTNRCGYELPQTGGRGTNLYTIGGLLQMTAAVLLLYVQKKRDRKTDGST